MKRTLAVLLALILCVTTILAPSGEDGLTEGTVVTTFTGGKTADTATITHDMGVDATTKWKEEGFDRDWPDRIEMDADTKARVDAMWGELGIRLTPRRNP